MHLQGVGEHDARPFEHRGLDVHVRWASASRQLQRQAARALPGTSAAERDRHDDAREGRIWTAQLGLIGTLPVPMPNASAAGALPGALSTRNVTALPHAGVPEPEVTGMKPPCAAQPPPYGLNTGALLVLRKANPLGLWSIIPM